MINFVSNSLKFSKNDSEIQVHLELLQTHNILPRRSSNNDEAKVEASNDKNITYISFRLSV